MSPIERDYFRRRANEERACAAQATSVAAEIHLELATLYEKLVTLEEADEATVDAPDRLSA